MRKLTTKAVSSIHFDVRCQIWELHSFSENAMISRISFLCGASAAFYSPPEHGPPHEGAERHAAHHPHRHVPAIVPPPPPPVVGAVLVVGAVPVVQIVPVVGIVPVVVAVLVDHCVHGIMGHHCIRNTR